MSRDKWNDNQNTVPIRLMTGDPGQYFEPITKRNIGDSLYLEVRMQGCLKRCIGCWYPKAKAMYGGEKHYVQEIIEILDGIKQVGRKVTGIILTGGEPFLQPVAILELVNYTKPRDMKIICYSGYYFEELLGWGDARRQMLDCVDILIDGPFDESKICDDRLPWVTTSDQRIIDVKKSLESREIILCEDDKLW